jgi:hypothetical protein
MSRYDMLTVLLKAVGAYCAVYALAVGAQTTWFIATPDNKLYRTFAEIAFGLAHPGMYLLGAAILIFASGTVARICGVRPGT